MMEIGADLKLGSSFISTPSREFCGSPERQNQQQYEKTHTSSAGTGTAIPRTPLSLPASDPRNNLYSTLDKNMSDNIRLYPSESPCPIGRNPSLRSPSNGFQRSVSTSSTSSPRVRNRSNSGPVNMMSQMNHGPRAPFRGDNGTENLSDGLTGIGAGTDNFKIRLSPSKSLSRSKTTPLISHDISSKTYTDDLNIIKRGQEMESSTPMIGDTRMRTKRSLIPIHIRTVTPSATPLAPQPPPPLRLSASSPSKFSSTTKEEFESKRASSPLSLWDYLVLEVTNAESAVPKEDKAESVFNMAKIPLELEKVMSFGFLECLDTFLYIFTILPIRLFLGLCIMLKNLMTKRTFGGLQRLHKADIVKGIIFSFTISLLSMLDTSRIYHNIRGQAAMKLYVTFSVLEVADKLCSALGQDIIECLFSPQSLDGGSSKQGKNILLRYSRLLVFLVLGIIYSCVHSMVLLYQIITLNVAVLSYSNALLTLLLSNQFAEIKSAVFKKFERENLFQLTCADITERFQLWVMLLAIGLRNIVEVGSTGLIPNSWSGWNRWLGALMGPGFMVLGSEVAVDWLKHSYIAKFNNIRPRVYQKFLEVLVRDHSDHLLSDQIITKRLGLPTIPLACVLARICYQTYQILLENSEGQMFYPAHTTTLPYIKDTNISVVPSNKALPTTFASSSSSSYFGDTTAGSIMNMGAQFFHSLFNYVRTVFDTTVPYLHFNSMSAQFFQHYRLDEEMVYHKVYYYISACLFFILIFTLLLMVKLILGLCLFKYSSSRASRDVNSREREREKKSAASAASKPHNSEFTMKNNVEKFRDDDFVPGTTRGGPSGVIEMDERMRLGLYDEGEEIPLKKEKPKTKPSLDFLNVERFKMVGKKIW